MSTRQLATLTTVGTHEVGNLNSWKIRTLPLGAKVARADIDNFLLVELAFDSDGSRTCETLSDVTYDSYLIASPEIRMLGNVANEQYVDFYNAVGDYARIVILDKGIRFDTSAYSLDAGIPDPLVGQVAHFDPASKTYILQTVGAELGDYGTANKTFYVVGVDTDTEYTLGKATVKLEVK